MTRSLLAVVLALAACGVVAGEEAWPGWRGKARHVVIAVIDGPRWSETWGDPTFANIPHMARELAPLGTRYTRFRNTGWTYTNCGHTALTTGFYEHIENSGKQLPAHPSLFQYYRAATLRSAESTWVIASKDKLFILGNTTDPQWQGRLQPRIDCGLPAAVVGTGGYREDVATMAVIEQVLVRDRPDLLLFNLKEPDAAGHAKDWPGYLAGIRRNDAFMARLWQLIQADPQLRDQTNLFITNDHGRHLDGHSDGYVSHGDACEGCRQISLLALGPDIPAGRVIDVPRNQTDLAVTIAWLAGISLPGSPGQRMDELLDRGQ